MNVLSLFAGVKIDKYFASEINPSAINVCMANYSKTIQLGDVCSIDVNTLPKIDLLIGGSPCQDLRPNREGLRGKKSKLFYEYLRILNELKSKNPNIKFMLENVYKISPDDKQIITELLGVTPEFICSSRFSAQKRKRLYWTNISIAPLPLDNSVLSDIVSECEDLSLYLTNEQLERAVIKHSAQTYKTGNKMGAVKFPTPLNEKSKCINVVTIKADRATTHIVDKLGIRILSINEREKLQTLPLNYTAFASEKERFDMTGNGWTIDVIAHIFKGFKIKTMQGLQLNENKPMGGIAGIPKEVRDQIDAQLLAMAKINAQMGADTSTDDKIEFRRQINLCLKEIKRLDKDFYEEIVPDKTEKN